MVVGAARADSVLDRPTSNQDGNEPRAIRGDRLAAALPPRRVLTDLSDRRYLWGSRARTSPRTSRPVWRQAHTLETWDLGVVTFDGVTFANYSRRWVNVYARIDTDCR
jgi:hypothetical protein